MVDYPAFPIDGTNSGDAYNGLTMRDYFAAKAMQGEWAAQGEACGIFLPEVSESTLIRCAKLYYRMADAMLAEREK